MHNLLCHLHKAAESGPWALSSTVRRYGYGADMQHQQQRTHMAKHEGIFCKTVPKTRLTEIFPHLKCLERKKTYCVAEWVRKTN